MLITCVAATTQSSSNSEGAAGFNLQASISGRMRAPQLGSIDG